MSDYDKKVQLLCTFTKLDKLEKCLIDIKNNYDVVRNRIIIVQNEADENQLYCIYNVGSMQDNDYLKSTILVHRKKKTNTIYTINSLNQLIWRLNDGNFDNKFIVPWDDYKNTLFLIQNNELNVIKTTFYKVIDLEKCNE